MSVAGQRLAPVFEAPPDPSHRREFILTDSDFLRVRRMIYQRAGIALSEQKREMVYSRLSRRLRELDMTEFTSYLTNLDDNKNSREWEEFTNALTTNLTSFYRESHHFPLLAAHASQCTQPMTVWCSAASTGEEPYSIAMTLIEALGGRASQAKVIATDIDTQVLKKAVTGIYTVDQVSKISPERLKRFFLKGTGAQAGLVKVRPEVMAMVSFFPLNLLEHQWPLKDPFDAIFCRNVMIYFDKPTQAKILQRFTNLMKPQGLLFAGHSENFSDISAAFRLRGQTVYSFEGKC
ncbi:CheR family methyltransferase [Glaciimonas soli]|uniref:Chemotaxis protein methyltransferase n=1 Tax=Glaciimonas soli TaxID=2590999 RepID=A0A843YPT5_9BURK|nr:CheR family methyltransferase [Glaciimonas soli]MQQ99477.1 chemotaxis protein CheR [Glaciimonas soli]